MRSILAVDDELHMLRLLEQLITKKTSYDITTTHNALEVPKILDSRQYDVIITDLRMPGLDGLDILRLIHEQKRNEEVIVITAFGTLESATEAFSLGAVDYITKPFKRERLIHSLHDAMYRQMIRSDAAQLLKFLQTEPFDSAVALFKQAYVEHLVARTGGDMEAMMNRSGLPEMEIEALMKET